MQKFHGMCDCYSKAILLNLLLGVSPTNGLPFSPPIAFRNRKIPRAQKHQKDVMLEGHCHKCKSWIAVEGPNHGDTKVSILTLMSKSNADSYAQGQRALLVCSSWQLKGKPTD